LGIEVREDIYFVSGLTFFCWEGIMATGGDPQATAGVKGYLDRLIDAGLGSNELDLETSWDSQSLLLSLGCERVGGGNQVGR
jgi:hypothetical protein